MTVDNKIEKTFSGPLVIMGVVFLVIAVLLVLSHHFIFGIISFIAACFILFTYSGTEIDIEKRMMKPYYMVFGFLKRGKWIPVEKYRGLTLVPMKKVYSVYSRSNKMNSTYKNDFRVYIINNAKKPAFALKSCKTRDDAQNSMDEFAIWLHLPVYSIRKH